MCNGHSNLYRLRLLSLIITFIKLKQFAAWNLLSENWAADVRGESSPIASFRAQIRFYKQRKIQLSFRRKPIV
jgi:hypothetical protein